MICFGNQIGWFLYDQNFDVSKFSEKGLHRWCFTLNFWKILIENFMLLLFIVLDIYNVSIRHPTMSQSDIRQCVNPTSQIPNNFHTKLGKIELFITFDREVLSTWTFHQLRLLITPLSKMAPKNRKSYFSHIWRAIASEHLFSCKMLVNQLKDLVSVKNYGTLKLEYRFSIFAKKWWRQQNYGYLGTDRHIFWKALMVHDHCTKFTVSSNSLTSDIGRRQKRPPGLHGL